MSRDGLSGAVLDSAVGETRTRDLSITSPTFYPWHIESRVFAVNLLRYSFSGVKLGRLFHISQSRFRILTHKVCAPASNVAAPLVFGCIHGRILEFAKGSSPSRSLFSPSPYTVRTTDENYLRCLQLQPALSKVPVYRTTIIRSQHRRPETNHAR